MRILFLVVIATAAIALGLKLFGHSQNTVFVTDQSSALESSSRVSARKPDFDSEIKPLLQNRCQPCHFQGGKVYDKLPFDRPDTIKKLGTRLFTRIKDEKEQKLIRDFLR